MASLLSLGAGAGDGLEQLLSRLMAEERLRHEQARISETGRANKARESLDERQLIESSALRRATQASTDRDRADRERDRTVDNIRQTVKLRPIDSTVTSGERDREVGVGGIPEGNYAYRPPSMGMSTPQGEVGPSEERISWLGTPEQRAAMTNQRLLDEDRDANRRIRSHAEDRITGWGPPTITIGDPAAPGGSRIVGRDQIPKEGAAAPLPAGERTRVDAIRETIALLDEIEKHPDKDFEGALGLWDATVGAAAHNYAGVDALGGGGSAGESLRDKLNALKARASFQEGGKQFTGTERDLLNSFLADVKHNPQAARTRLKEFRKSAERALTNVGAAKSSDASAIDQPEMNYDPATGTFTRKKTKQ